MDNINSDGWVLKWPIPRQSSFPTAITDQIGTFALIIGKKSHEIKVMIFDEQNGFQELASGNVNLSGNLMAISIQ